MHEGRRNARDERGEVVVDTADGSEWSKLVDALYVVAASLERVRAAHSTDKTSLAVYVHGGSFTKRRRDGAPGGTLTMVDPLSHESGFQSSLENLAGVIVREGVPDRPAVIARRREEGCDG